MILPRTAGKHIEFCNSKIVISRFLAKTSREIATKITRREKIQHIENSVYMKNVVENKFRKITYREPLIKLQHIENCLHKNM